MAREVWLINQASLEAIRRGVSVGHIVQSGPQMREIASERGEIDATEHEMPCERNFKGLKASQSRIRGHEAQHPLGVAHFAASRS
jgi:hypothetical protein